MGDEDSVESVDQNPLVRRTTTVVRLDKVRKLPWKQRLFRKTYPGSMRRSIMMWVGMCMGTGNLTLPFFYSNLGVLPATALLLASCFINLKMCTFINEMAMASNSTNFYTLVQRTVPAPFFVIFKYSLFVDILTTMMSGSVATWKLFEFLIYNLGIGRSHWKEWILDFDNFEVNEYHPTIIIFRGIFYLLLYVTLVRLFFKRSLGPLSIFLQLCVLSTIALVAFTIIDMPLFLNGYKDEDIGVHLIKPINWSWITGFYGFCFCYYIQPYMLTLRSELSLPTPKRVTKMMTFGFCIQAFLYSLLGLSAYLSLGDKYTPEIITTRKPYPGRNEIWESCYKLVNIMYFLSNALYLASYSPTLKVCMRAFLKIKSKNRRRFVLSTFPFTVCCILSFAYPNVTNIIAMCSSTLCNFNGYIIPTLMKIKLVNDEKQGRLKLVALYPILIFFLFSLGYATVSPILGLFF